MQTLGATVDSIFAACEATPSLYVEMLSALRPKLKGRTIRMQCPSCNDKDSGWVVAGDKTIRCNHGNKCGGETHVLSALMGRNDPYLTDDAFIEAVRLASSITGVEMGVFDFSPPSTPPIPTDALETLWRIANETFASDSGVAARIYCDRRGFSGDFSARNFGTFANLVGLPAVVDLGSLNDLGLFCGNYPNPQWSERLVFPCRNAHGKLVGLYSRCIAQETRPQKYWGTTGYQKSLNPFGFDRARRFKKVIVVEGHLCALKLQMYGFDAVIAVGSNHLSGEQLKLLDSNGIEQITTFFDNDAPGEKGIEKLLDSWDNAPNAPELFVGTIPAGKDVDDYVERCGITAFLELTGRAIHALRFRANKWFLSLDRDSFGCPADGQIARYIERCVGYTESNSSKRLDLRSDIFLTEVSKLSGVERSEIVAVRAELAHRKKSEESAKSLLSALSRSYLTAKSGDINASREMLRTALDETAEVKPLIISVEQSWNEVANYFERVSKSELIGIKTGFRPFDENLLGARGLILVAGGSNVGKTTFTAQCMTDAALLNKDTCVLMLSFEMKRREINGRTLARLAERDWKDLRDYFDPEKAANTLELKKFCQENLFANCLIIEPFDIETGRFIWNPENVMNQVNNLKKLTGRRRCAIIIDYLDVVPGYEEIARGNENFRQQLVCKDLVALKHALGDDDPIIAITQVRKQSGQAGDRENLTMDDVMGSAMRVYCSDVVAIWNVVSDRYLYETCDLHSEYGPIMIASQEPIESDWKSIKDKPETRAAVRKARSYLESKGVGFSTLHFAKIRDGMTKGLFNLTVNYRRNSIQEYFNV